MLRGCACQSELHLLATLAWLLRPCGGIVGLFTNMDRKSSTKPPRDVDFHGCASLQLEYQEVKESRARDPTRGAPRERARWQLAANHRFETRGHKGGDFDAARGEARQNLIADDARKRRQRAGYEASAMRRCEASFARVELGRKFKGRPVGPWDRRPAEGRSFNLQEALGRFKRTGDVPRVTVEVVLASPGCNPDSRAVKAFIKALLATIEPNPGPGQRKGNGSLARKLKDGVRVNIGPRREARIMQDMACMGMCMYAGHPVKAVGGHRPRCPSCGVTLPKSTGLVQHPGEALGAAPNPVLEDEFGASTSSTSTTAPATIVAPGKVVEPVRAPKVAVPSPPSRPPPPIVRALPLAQTTVAKGTIQSGVVPGSRDRALLRCKNNLKPVTYRCDTPGETRAGQFVTELGLAPTLNRANVMKINEVRNRAAEQRVESGEVSQPPDLKHKKTGYVIRVRSEPVVRQNRAGAQGFGRLGEPVGDLHVRDVVRLGGLEYKLPVQTTTMAEIAQEMQERRLRVRGKVSVVDAPGPTCIGVAWERLRRTPVIVRRPIAGTYLDGDTIEHSVLSGLKVGPGHLVPFTTRIVDEVVPYKTDNRLVSCRPVKITSEAMRVIRARRLLFVPPSWLAWSVCLVSLVLSAVVCALAEWDHIDILKGRLTLGALTWLGCYLPWGPFIGTDSGLGLLSYTIRPMLVSGLVYMAATLVMLVGYAFLVGLKAQEIAYAPHMVACLLRDMEVSMDYQLAKENIRAKSLRLATLPLADYESTRITVGSELVALELFKRQQFFGVGAGAGPALPIKR